MKSTALGIMLILTLSLLSGCMDDRADSVSEDRQEPGISGKVTLVNATVENTSTDDNVTSALISAVLTTGSDNTTMDKIYYYFTCVRNGTSIHLEDVYLTGDAELEAGDIFEFIAELSECAAYSDPEREEEQYFRLGLGMDGGGGINVNLGISGSNPQKGDSLT